MEALLRKYYGIEADKVKKLVGYENVNYLVESGGRKYIFKTYAFDENLADLLMAETSVLLALQDTFRGQVPEPLPTVQGDVVGVGDIHGKKGIFRLLTFLEGTFMAEAVQDQKLATSLGSFLARLDKSLLPLKNYTIAARQFVWDLQHAHLAMPMMAHIQDPSQRKLVEYFMLQFDEQAMPVLPYLSKSIIHNDANDWNVLVTNGKVSGIIDFGDIAYAPRIDEIAIAITYLMMDKEDPLSLAAEAVRAYHEVLPLQEQELQILYYLVGARLCVSVCSSAQSRWEHPGNDYAAISEEGAWQLLQRWLTINPLLAGKTFKKACNFHEKAEEPVEDKIARRHKHIDAILSISYKKPLYVTGAAFQYMYDGYGNTFLDAYNNIPHVGHQHPRVVRAGQRQMARLNTNTRYVYDLLADYAGKLLDKFPAKLSKVYFVNSGSAASDLAIRLARHYAGSRNIMVMEHGYHGHTNTAIDISDYKFSNKKGPGQQQYILKVPIPDTYRGVYQGADAGQKYAQKSMELIHNFDGKIAAFISEPIVGCGGQVPLAPGYLAHLYPAIRAQGGLCISDEVQTGFGRLGEHFWGFEAQGVIPDIVVLGKPMGNGHPMGAVVTTDEVAKAFGQGVEFFSSFGGNPVSCAIGLEVLRVLEEEGLQQNALETGNYYQKSMNQLKAQHACIGDVRGSGLFLGFEMVDENGAPDTALAARIKNALREQFILVSTDGPYDNVIKSKPPLCFTKENVDRVVEAISGALKKTN